MKRTFIHTDIFCRIFDKLVSERKLSSEDFEQFEQSLLTDPKAGDVIPGMEGLRKARMKSTSHGKRGGFRVDYLDLPEYAITYYIVIYPKNVKDDLSTEEKKVIVNMIKQIKMEVKNG